MPASFPAGFADHPLPVQACIVRVMKDRKAMSHNELVQEVIRQLVARFQPAPALVKRRIESLIDRVRALPTSGSRRPLTHLFRRSTSSAPRAR